MRKCAAIFAVAAALHAIPTVALADTIVTLHVETKNRPAGDSMRIPVEGDYKFVVEPSLIIVGTPTGIAIFFDFDKKLVDFIDRPRRTYYEFRLDDWLDFGDQLPPTLANRYLEQGFISFKPVAKQEPITVNGQPANPYHLEMEASIQRQAPDHGTGIRRRGGLTDDIPDPTPAQLGQDPLGPLADNKYRLSSAGEKIAGQLWMASPTFSEVENERLAIAEESVLLGASPQLKAVSNRIRRSKLALLGADFTISILDQDGLEPSKPAIVSARLVSVEISTGLQQEFPLMSSYSKIAPPPFPLGTSN